MVQVIFYGKPGCKGNARQMRVLQASGHDVEFRDLLSEAWTASRLKAFFGAGEVAGWFNRSAVRIKSGEIVPEELSPEAAMALLLADPALIRRPLLEAEGARCVGWEPDRVARWIGLGAAMSPGKEGCAGGGGPKATRGPLAATDCRVAAAKE
jgi:nitrogenase-associated protein